MVLDTAGKPVNVTNLAKQANLGEHGTYVADLETVLRDKGVSSARYTNGSDVSMGTIAKSTQRGHPAIVRVELQGNNGKKYGHFVVVDGVTNRQGQNVVAVRDPNGGRQYFVPVDEFEQRLGGKNRHAIFTNPKMEGKGWVFPH
jgi:ABC-type bacteriocin/lantibiotic exporter with double-glycine peptidase domain